jgi:hypothetical protein
MIVRGGRRHLVGRAAAIREVWHARTIPNRVVASNNPRTHVIDRDYTPIDRDYGDVTEVDLSAGSLEAHRGFGTRRPLSPNHAETRMAMRMPAFHAPVA